jgi:hypothetical protein
MIPQTRNCYIAGTMNLPRFRPFAPIFLALAAVSGLLTPSAGLGAEAGFRWTLQDLSRFSDAEVIAMV